MSGWWPTYSGRPRSQQGEGTPEACGRRANEIADKPGGVTASHNQRSGRSLPSSRYAGCEKQSELIERARPSSLRFSHLKDALSGEIVEDVANFEKVVFSSTYLPNLFCLCTQWPTSWLWGQKRGWSPAVIC